MKSGDKNFFYILENNSGTFNPLCGIMCPVGGRKCLLVNTYIHLMKREE